MSGFVYLVGAGPGDPDLLTLRAVKAIGLCDVLFVDDLVSRGVLAHARSGAPIVRVGKRAGRARVTQATIDAVLVSHARAGKVVGRIKGGDPNVFGRVGEEMGALARAGIPFEVVPGVSAALGAAAGARVPLTMRGVASSVAFVTARRADDGGVSIDARADTLVVYMGRDVLADVARAVIADGRSPSTPVAVVRAATTPREAVRFGTLGALANDAHWRAWLAVDDPVIAVIGEVAGLSTVLQSAIDSANATRHEMYALR